MVKVIALRLGVISSHNQRKAGTYDPNHIAGGPNRLPSGLEVCNYIRTALNLQEGGPLSKGTVLHPPNSRLRLLSA